MSPWGWMPEHSDGIWRHGARWARPAVSASPYLMVLLLMLMLHFVGGTLTSAHGVLFDLPAAGLADGDKSSLAVLVMPIPHETVVFFDDSRYLLGDPTSVRVFEESLAGAVSRSDSKTLVVLADRRVAGGELMDLAAIAKRNGVNKVLFAEKRIEKPE